jgi:hypothetical protein
MKIINYVNCILIFLLAACSQEQKISEKYFDFDGLIDEQISQLSQRMRVLDKIAEMSGISSDTTFLPSVKGWGSELEIFRQLEIINKPIYRDVYRVEDPLEDPKSNLKIRQFEAASAPVPSIRFYYQDNFSHLKKIEAVINEKNVLYATRRVMVIEFDEEDGERLITRYGMNGFQKMILRDTVRFSVLGQIDW